MIIIIIIETIIFIVAFTVLCCRKVKDQFYEPKEHKNKFKNKDSQNNYNIPFYPIYLCCLVFGIYTDFPMTVPTMKLCRFIISLHFSNDFILRQKLIFENHVYVIRSDVLY